VAVLLTAAVWSALAQAQQVGAAQPAGGGMQAQSQGGGLQPQGQAGALQPADQPQAQQPGSSEDLAAQDFSDPPALGDLNIRVPLTLRNLAAGIERWSLSCAAYRSWHLNANRLVARGLTSGAVHNGGFSGAVIVTMVLPEGIAAQDVHSYQCVVSLQAGGTVDWMRPQNAGGDVRFRALQSSTFTSNAEIKGGPYMVGGSGQVSWPEDTAGGG
jgi:hypothetical protein